MSLDSLVDSPRARLLASLPAFIRAGHFLGWFPHGWQGRSTDKNNGDHGTSAVKSWAAGWEAA